MIASHTATNAPGAPHARAFVCAVPGLRTNPAADEGTALMLRIAAHDQPTFEHFYRTTISRVFGLALRITRNRATAEEVAEDVYVQLWHRATSFDASRGSPLGWTLTICRSRALDALRRCDPAVLDPEPHERCDAWVETGGDPQDLLHASRQSATLHIAIQKLAPLQRQLLALAFFGDMAHAQMAAHTGLPLGTVKSTLRRTLATLRQDLGCP